MRSYQGELVKVPTHIEEEPYFRAWRIDDIWQSIADALRVQVRIKAGRDPTPSAAIIDSQSAKTTEKGGRAVTTPARK